MNIEHEIEKYRNEIYQMDIRLPYCQWDSRNLVNNATEYMNVQRMNEAKGTWEIVNKKAKERGLNSLGLGIVLMKEQAINAIFKPSKNWLNGKYVFGNSIREIYHNTNPIISVVKKYERVYRLKTVNERGRIVPGKRCFPTQEELARKDFRESLFIYDVYLVALLDKEEDGSYKLLHQVPFTFAPKKTMGLKFAEELKNFYLQCSAFVPREVARFIFTIHLQQELTICTSKNDETLSSQVMRMSSIPITTKEELYKRYVGENIGDILQRWYATYVSPYSVESQPIDIDARDEIDEIVGENHAIEF